MLLILQVDASLWPDKSNVALAFHHFYKMWCANDFTSPARQRPSVIKVSGCTHNEGFKEGIY